VRIAREAAPRRRHLHEVEQLVRAPERRLAIAAAVPEERLDDLLSDRVDRIERGHWLLEDHRDDAAAEIFARILVWSPIRRAGRVPYRHQGKT